MEMKEKIIRLEDIQPGDVISAEATTLIGLLIASLTASNVSHSALVYYDKKGKEQLDKKQMVQVGLEGVEIDLIESLLREKDLYISRFVKKYEDDNFDMTPVINVAENYVHTSHLYGWSEIALFVPYYLTCYLPMSKKTQDEIVKHSDFVDIAFAAFSGVYALWHKEQKVVCSQFVYNCFQEAGEDYHITYEKGYEDKSLIRRMRGQQGIENIIISLHKNGNLALRDDMICDDSRTEDMIRTFTEIFNNANKENDDRANRIEVFTDEFLRLMGRNLLGFCQLILPEWSNIEASSMDKILDAVTEYILKYPTPENLKSNFPDLILIGKINALK